MIKTKNGPVNLTKMELRVRRRDLRNTHKYHQNKNEFVFVSCSLWGAIFILYNCTSAYKRIYQSKAYSLNTYYREGLDLPKSSIAIRILAVSNRKSFNTRGISRALHPKPESIEATRWYQYPILNQILSDCVCNAFFFTVSKIIFILT